MKWMQRFLVMSVLFCWAGPGFSPETAFAQESAGGAPKKKTKKPGKEKKEEKSRKKPKPAGFKVGPESETNYRVDSEAAKNEVTFTSTAPKETIVGKASVITAQLDLNPRKLAKSKGEFRVAWKDIDTGNPMKNQHMISPPWVEGSSHPDIIFTLKDIKDIKRNKSGKSIKAKLVGTMAMNGAEKEMKIPATLVYLVPKEEDKEDAKEGIGIRAKFSIALEDFNIQGRGVGKAVAAEQKIKVSVFLARQMEEEDEADKSKDASDSD